MVDLLGDEIQAMPESPDYGFEQFWTAWPTGPRKVAKRQCLAKWVKFGLAQKAAHIIAHVHHMKTEDCWLREGGRFVCAPTVYLNQERWLDWTPPAPVKREPDALQKILSHKGAPMPANVREYVQRLRRTA